MTDRPCGCGLHLTEHEAWLVEEFVACLRADAPIDGLTRQQSQLVHVLRAARGRVLSYAFLADSIANRRDEPVDPKIVTVRLCHIRRLRPDLAAHIVAVWGDGLKWQDVAEDPAAPDPCAKRRDADPELWRAIEGGIKDFIFQHPTAPMPGPHARGSLVKRIAGQVFSVLRRRASPEGGGDGGGVFLSSPPVGPASRSTGRGACLLRPPPRGPS